MNELTVTAPTGALCCLYPNAPASRDLSAIDPDKSIPATAVTADGGITTYYYAGLAAGLYHCAVSMPGYNSLCRMIGHTGSTKLDMTPEKLAGNGYEAGFVMRFTREFEETALRSGRDVWGQRYGELFCTPQFLPGRPGRHQQTTNEELSGFIAKLRDTSRHMHVFSLGRSPKYGYDLPLVLFTHEPVAGMTLEQAAKRVRGNGKPTVQYIAQCHSTEPASCEGALAMMAALCGSYGKVLDAVDVYIIPRVNPDGAYEVTRRSPTTGEDMNRDYLFMHNRELRMVANAYNLFRPEVAIDGHEKRHSFQSAGEDICTDMELQTGTGSLNHPAAMTELAMKMALKALENARALGLRSHFYGKLASAAGGAAGSSYFGTRNSLSFLVETPGQVNMGMCAMERRVLAHYVLASTVIDYTAQNAREILDTVHGSREHMRKTGPVYDENDVIVLEHGETETGTWATPLIHVPTGRVTDPSHAIPYREQTQAVFSRPRATAYVLPAGLAREQEILRVADNHALEYYRVGAGSALPLKQYLQTDAEIALTEEQTVCFENGALVFPNTADSTVLGVIMEPDFCPSAPERKMTLLRMGLIAPDPHGRLPLYRCCHDLVNGKIEE